MSSLNFDAQPNPATNSGATAPQSAEIVLTPPTPVVAVTTQQADSVTNQVVPTEKQSQATAMAQSWVSELLKNEFNSPAFRAKVAEVTAIGTTEINQSSSASNRMLQRPAVRNQGDTAQTRVSNTLSELRRTVTELDPNRADLTGGKKLLKFLPGGVRNKIEDYFAKYQSAQSQLDAITASLASGQDELRKDNAEIDVVRKDMWEAMGKLGQYKILAEEIGRAVENKANELEAMGQTEEATGLRADVLFAANQRHQDIMTQMAVNVQGYLALDVVQKNNTELIKGVDRARTTTLSALRTAVIVSQALSQQQIVLNQINAVNAATSDMILKTSEQLKQQGSQINQQASQASVDVEKLKSAFQNVFEALDAVDTYRIKANDSIKQTIGALETQVASAQTYLERSNRGQS
ncbi:toxic anion resistance protein [Micrococcales bacterium 31B]|nr:toxic anion resistance protein [Micrococcales bacterium 31B]